MRFQIIAVTSGEVLDNDATPTPWILCEWRSRKGMAVKRGGCWLATDYPGFVVEPTETPILVQVKEVR